MYETQAGKSRIEVIDLARGAALLAMAIYHFTWDLEFFGYLDPGTVAQGGWKFFARSIASSFLFLVGVSLFLAHSGSVRLKPFLRRLATIGGAALTISIATYFATPDRFIFFGILHQIALASLLGLLFLRLPAPLTLAIAAIVVAAPFFLRAPLFDYSALWWVGLSSSDPPSNDYVPLFPWFGAVLAGIAVAQLAAAGGLFLRLRALHPGKWTTPLRFAGRHSLAVYLIHQPVLIGFIWLYAQVDPAPTESREMLMLQSCERQCALDHEKDFCARYCMCVLDRLDARGMLDEVFSTTQSQQTQAAVEETARQCTAAAGAGEDVE